MPAAALFVVIATTAFLLQTTLLPLAAVPDLLLIICVYLGLYHHSVGGAFGAFVLGYLEDTSSGTLTGLNACGMCLVFVLVHLTSQRLWVDNTISKVVLVFLASVLKTGVLLALLTLLRPSPGVWRSLPGSVLIEAVLAAVLSPAVFAVLARTRQLRLGAER
ncbi:MAG: rod shape-determining protein MreD [Candidatus Binatia bacterium]